MRYVVMVFQMLSTGINPNNIQNIIYYIIYKYDETISKFMYEKWIEHEPELVKVHCQHFRVHAKTDTVGKIPGLNGNVHEVGHRSEVHMQKSYFKSA